MPTSGRSPVFNLRRTGAMLVVGAVILGACSSGGAPTTAEGSGAAGASSGPSPSAGSGGRPPNIVYVLADDMRLDDLEYMPNTKKLIGDQGATFTNFFVNVSLCCPSRVSGLRGQYSHNSGILTNGGSNGGFETAYALGLEKETIATTLQAGGYRTGFYGKYLNGYPRTAGDTYVPPGWSDWHSASKGNAYGEYNYTLNENGKLVEYGKRAEDYGTDVYMREASSFIAESARRGEPFYTYISLYAPHTPSTPAPRHQDLFADVQAPRPPSFNEADVSDKPAYVQRQAPLTEAQQANIDRAYRLRLQSMQSIDEGVGQLYEQLKASGQLDNTYIVFTSDNGFHLGERRMVQGKQTPYESDIRLPFVMRGPGIAAGSRVDALTGNVDIAPTLAEVAGVAPPTFTDGRSLLALVSSSPPSADRWRQVYLLEHWTESSGSRPPTTRRQRSTGIGADGVQTEPPDLDVATQAAGDDDEETDQTDQTAPPGRTRRSAAARSPIPEFQGLRTARYAYVEYATGERELYDLEADPHELANLASSADPALLAALHQRLNDLRSCSAQACRDAEAKAL